MDLSKINLDELSISVESLCNNPKVKIDLSKVNIDIEAITKEFESLKLNNNCKPKTWIYEGKEYTLDYDKKPKELYKIIFDINKLKNVGCTRQIGVCKDVRCSNCYPSRFINNIKCFYWSNKNREDPVHISTSSHKKYWFNCNKCYHEFETCISSVKNGIWCPYCSVPRKALCNDMTCVSCYNCSFMGHYRHKEWNYEKNSIHPRFVFRGSPNRYYLKCDICNHELYMILTHVNNSTKCKYCSNKELCGKCDICFHKSLASYPMSKYLSKKNVENPMTIFLGSSTKKCIFDCFKCNHEFETTPDLITNGHWCPYCCERSQKLCGSCNLCFNKSLSSSYMIKYFSNKNIENPLFIFKRSNDKKYIWNCDRCENEFESCPLNVDDGGGCSKCRYKTQYKLYNFLKKNFNVITEHRTNWCKNINTNWYLPFDFLIEDLKLLVELDGPQHFKKISNWADPEETLHRDVFKMKCSLDNNYSLIRILQEDIWLDRNDWQSKLENAIKKYDEPICIFIDNDDIYFNHINRLKLKGVPGQRIIIIN